MFNRLLLQAGCVALIAGPHALYAAPLDAFLTAHPTHHAGEMTLELAYDAMNNTLDVLGVRANDPLYANTNVGDYSGAHVRAAYGLTDDLSLDGGYWQRKIAYRQDNETLQSWQAAAQYRVYGDVNSAAQYALRLSAWGDQAGTLNKSSPTLFAGKTINAVSVASPQDKQFQLDAIGTWQLTKQTEVSAFAGLGSSEVTTGNMTANYTRAAGCNYNLTFTPTGTSGQLVPGTCPPGTAIVITSFTTPLPVVQEFSYRSSYYQLGGMMQWVNQDWRLRGGYQFQSLKRGNVDALVVSRGGVVYNTNHTVLAEVAYKITQNTALFARGQIMSNQFVGEIPFVYNGVTASKFSRRYGMASFGVMMGF